MFTMERFIDFYFELGLKYKEIQSVCSIQGIVLGHSKTLNMAKCFKTVTLEDQIR